MKNGKLLSAHHSENYCCRCTHAPSSIWTINTKKIQILSAKDLVIVNHANSRGMRTPFHLRHSSLQLVQPTYDSKSSHRIPDPSNPFDKLPMYATNMMANSCNERQLVAFNWGPVDNAKAYSAFITSMNWVCSCFVMGLLWSVSCRDDFSLPDMVGEGILKTTTEGYFRVRIWLYTDSFCVRVTPPKWRV